MTKWKDEYEKFKQSDQWIAVIKNSDDLTHLPEEEDFFRFKELVEYISGIIEALDSCNYPLINWADLNSQIQGCATFVEQKNYKDANSFLVVMLSELKNFVNFNAELITVIGNSVNSYTKNVDDLKLRVNEQQNDFDILKLENEDILKSQKRQYDALFKELNSLLHGATSVGLARAYSNRRKVARRSVIIYTISFVFAVLSLFGIYFGGMYYLISLEYELYSEFIKNFWNINHWGARSLILAPFIGTISWLAIFCLKRRSEYFRLEEEYAHKEALATSYESYRKQINELNEDKGTDTGLLEKLINVSIDAIKFKPAETLNKKKGWIGVFEELISRGKHSKCSNDPD